MERKGIIDAFNKRFSKLEHCVDELKIHFSPVAIHKFRIEVKKLKALVRLLKEGRHHKAPFKIPKRMKRLYRATGNVRTMQLREEHLSATISGKDWRLPENCFKDFSSEKQSTIDQAKKIIDKKRTIGKWKANISSFLIKGNARVNIKHFVESESEQLFQFLELKQPDDKSLHQFRKLIKNILYTWPFIRRDANILFPPGFSSYNHLKLISDLLGRFHDSCVDLTQLDSIIEDRSSFPKESKVLTEIKKEWEKDKAITRSVLMNKLNTPGDTGLFKGDRRQNST